MRTLCILLVFLVAVCVFIAQLPAAADCDQQSCWVTCQRKYTINFRNAFCDGSSCQCVFVTGG
uniref:Termicin n=1 Tax=Reticulitermes chinensis TaxID=141911 RepID=C9W4J9_9NEOP|nr:termicin [Reticulitermes chinensis]